MIDLFSRDMSKLIQFTIRRFKLSFPSDMDISDIEHEIAIGLYRMKEINATHIVHQVMWTRSKLWKEFYSRNRLSSHDGSYATDDNLIYAREATKQILAIKGLTDQEKQLLTLLAKGFDTAKICAKMEIKNRQRFKQIKDKAFFKVRTLCPEAKYWTEL